jgi:IS5 family transposase
MWTGFERYAKKRRRAAFLLKCGLTKVRYRGLNKNANRLFATLALANLFPARKKLLASASA